MSSGAIFEIFPLTSCHFLFKVDGYGGWKQFPKIFNNMETQNTLKQHLSSE